jgi:hypothetical protein
MKLLELNHDVLILIIQRSSFNLCKTCKFLFKIWNSRPSIRLNWLLFHSSDMRSAIDIAFTSKDIELAKLCIPKISVEYKAHLIIDLCRSEIASDNMILLLIDDSVLDINLSLYIRALVFQDNNYNDSLLYALQHIQSFKLPECILLFSLIFDRNLLVQRILDTDNLNIQASIEVIFTIGAYHNSFKSIKAILCYAPWIRDTESFPRAIAVCESKSFLELKSVLLHE